MGGKMSAPQLQEDVLSEICSLTGFNKKQVSRLYQRFVELDADAKGYLVKDDMLRIPELSVNPLGDRIVDAFFTESVDFPDMNLRDYDARGAFDKLDFGQFARVLARFQPPNKKVANDINTRLNKLRFAFSMYDLNKNNYITREEFKEILYKMVGSNVSADQLDSIVDRTIGEADDLKDGRISFQEFCRAMQRTDVEQKMSIRFLS